MNQNRRIIAIGIIGLLVLSPQLHAEPDPLIAAKQRLTEAQDGINGNVAEQHREHIASRLSQSAQPAHAEYPDDVGGLEPPQFPQVIGTIGDTVSTIQPVRHVLQLWRVLSPHAETGRYRLSIQHAEAGAAGAFRIEVWTDGKGDGIPDRRISMSETLSARRAGDWSSWDFESSSESLFVGNSWSQSDVQIYYSRTRPDGYTGLGDELYFSRTKDGHPSGRAQPRFTNLRLEFLGR